MNQTILVNPNLRGYEYGMLIDFQDEIARLTSATLVEVPPTKRLASIERKFAHGTRYARFRPLLRHSGFNLATDVLWTIMMGPENWLLDIYSGWDRKVGFKILYLFDTMESQLPSIRRVLRSTKWDLTITSFEGAVSMLEAGTQRKWFAIPQGVKLSRFAPSFENRRFIDFCAYGRRLQRIHEALREFCSESGHHYEYTTATGVSPGTHPSEHYQQYSWHLRHSIFNICWPVEVTHPQRVLTFSPITCRWFEAAASGNVVIGKAPADPGFTDLFGPDFVVDLDTELSDECLKSFWRRLWDKRSIYLECAKQRYFSHASKWSWETRVRDMVQLGGLEAPLS